MDDPSLYRDSSAVYHSTPRCPTLPRSTQLVTCSYHDMDGRRYERCERCIPAPLFVPRVGATERRVYHADLKCRSLPRSLRYPVLQYDWVWWPSWDYNHVIHDAAYVRCTRCIPDRSALYPLGRKPRRTTRHRPGLPRRHRRNAV